MNITLLTPEQLNQRYDLYMAGFETVHSDTLDNYIKVYGIDDVNAFINGTHHYLTTFTANVDPL